jgi:hypothetical protein
MPHRQHFDAIECWPRSMERGVAGSSPGDHRLADPAADRPSHVRMTFVLFPRLLPEA